MKKGSINLQYFYEEKGNEKTGHEYTDQAPALMMDIPMKINGFKTNFARHDKPNPRDMRTYNDILRILPRVETH